MPIQVEVQSITQEGEGLGKDKKGNTHFIPFSIPGELYQFEEESSRYELKHPSPDRGEPVCPAFKECGGCDYLHMGYSRQLVEKTNLVEFHFKKSNLPLEAIQPIRGSSSALFYRNRVHFKIENGQLGFFKRKSHELVAIEKCFLIAPELNEALQSKKLDLSKQEKLELVLERNGQVSQHWNLRQGEHGFRQVNPSQNEYLKVQLQEKIKESGVQTVLELYAGNGNLTSCYLKNVKEWIAIDSNKNAIEEAKQLSPSFLCEEINSQLVSKLPEDFLNKMQGILLDPPRSGMGSLLLHFLYPKVQHVFYVSCSLVSFCRDAKLLQERGFILQWAQPIDMFPQTKHLELLAVFKKV